MSDEVYSIPPTPQPKRANTLSIRLTQAERAQIKMLARQLGLSDSFMARHFILEAVKHYQFNTQEVDS